MSAYYFERLRPQARPAGVDALHGPIYRCPELQQPAPRAASTAIVYPSRIGNRLRYPDGRVTDLGGNPVECA
jgi:hypothetical protein